MPLSVGIIGAGIGGLTSALACRQAGFDVEVLCTSNRDCGDGAVDLPPNATRLLRALKVLDEVATLAVRPEAIHFRSWKSGYLIASRPLGAFAEDRYGAPHLQVLHSALLGVLRAELQRRDISVCEIAAIDSILQDDNSVTVQCDGRAIGFDVLIACDGAQSPIRRRLFGDDSARFAGRIEWQALVAGDAATKGRPRHSITRWLGTNGHFVHRDVDGGRQISMAGIIQSLEDPAECWTLHDRVDGFRAAFDAWHPHVLELIDRASTCRSRAVFEYSSTKECSRGRVVLLGNACHPILPYIDQSSSMAIEDAWILSRLLVDWEDGDVTSALTEHTRYRQPRTQRVQRAARESSQSFHEANALRALTRNFKLALSTRLLPEFAIEKFDWLYGYDAVKGFD